MKLYLAIRWGHAESPDGSDGEDTQLLIRASALADASKLADDALGQLPVSSPLSTRQVQPFCHRIIELGADASTDGAERVLLGPWVGRAFFDTAPIERGFVILSQRSGRTQKRITSVVSHKYLDISKNLGRMRFHGKNR